jgi:hypothetical protein
MSVGGAAFGSVEAEGRSERNALFVSVANLSSYSLFQVLALAFITGY